MPTVDFFFKAARVPLTHPYELKRLRHGSGEAVDYMLAGDAGSYGVYPLVRRQWRIIRVTNCTLADAQMVCGPEALSVDDIGKGFLARRRVWRLPLGNYPAMATRKAPDVDDSVFAGIRDAMLAAFPQLADVPLANRRQTIYDVQITRAQFIAALILRPNEPRDLSGQPTEAVEPDYTIDIQE